MVVNPARVTLLRIGNLGWVKLPSLSLGNITQPKLLYPVRSTLPRLGNLTQPGYLYPAFVTLTSLGSFTRAG